jgi:hypothetical protein
MRTPDLKERTSRLFGPREWIAVVAGAVISFGLLIVSTFLGFEAFVDVAVLSAAVLLGMLARSHRTAAAAFWLTLVLLFPPWINPYVGDYRIAPAAVFSFVVVLACLRRESWRLGAMDLWVGALAVALVVSLALGTPLFFVAQGLGEWVLCFLAARALGFTNDVKLASVFAFCGAALAVLAVIQAVTGFDASAFAPGLSPAPDGESWKVLQYRAGLLRAELLAGSTIALGGILALCLPFALNLDASRRRFICTVLIIAGIVVTQSRAAILCAGLILAWSFFTSPMVSLTVRRWTLRIVGLGLVVASPLVVYFFFLGGNNPYSEVTQGSIYRIDLLGLITKAHLLGLGSGYSPTGRSATTWSGDQSIDNSFLYIALYAGLIAAVAYFGPWFVAFGRFLTAKPTPSLVAVVAQIAFLLTIAPITQHQSIYWFVVGIAAGTALEKRVTWPELGWAVRARLRSWRDERRSNPARPTREPNRA